LKPRREASKEKKKSTIIGYGLVETQSLEKNGEEKEEGENQLGLSGSQTAIGHLC